MEEDNQTVITIHGEEISVKEAMKRFGVDSIIKRFGAWVVTDYGIECLARSYPIELHRVEENDWLSHMREKRWVNMEDFTMAFVYAESLFQKRKKFILEDRQLKVFLCHGKEDKPKIREIYIELSRLGINVWLDEESLFPGQDWELEIRREVKKSDLVLVC